MMLPVNEYFNQATERLTFRALTPDDVPMWANFFKNNDRLHFFNLDSKTVDSNNEAKIWIDRQIDRYRTQHLGLLAVIEKSSGQFIGMCGLIPRKFGSKEELEIGYSFLQKFWGCGYATEAAICMKNFVHKHYLAPRVVSMIHPQNFASQAVAIRNGMKPDFETNYEGTPVIVFASDPFEQEVK